MKDDRELITLCKHCKSDFEDAGVKITRLDWQENKTDCDYCHIRRGYTYIIIDNTQTYKG